MPLGHTATNYRLGTQQVQRIMAGTTLVWPKTPTLTSISPTSMEHLSGAITLTLTGTNFGPGCIAQIKGTGGWINISGSTVVNSTTMTGSVDMGPGRYKVSVVNGTQRSNEKDFTGNHNTPVLNSISPTQIYLEDGGQRLTVSGSNFYGGGSGYTGLTIYTLAPGGSWVARTAAVSSSTSAYTDGYDPSPTGTHQIMLGYDNPNAPRSAQKPLSVINRPPPVAVTSVQGNVDRFSGGTIYVNGTGLSGTVTLQVKPQGLDQGGPWGPHNCTVNSATQASVNGSQYSHNSSNFPDAYHNVTVVVNGTTFNLDNQPVKFT